ncbi:hypothetical protein EDD21DRAFT_354227 [Dissophora ornata]|nr:hypothetical protein EDD21DRAFT_354227 [Dissophora ornata]
MFYFAYCVVCGALQAVFPLCTATCHTYGLQHMHGTNSVLAYSYGTSRPSLYGSGCYGVQEEREKWPTMDTISTRREYCRSALPPCPFSPWRSVLTPQEALDLASVHLENARKAKSPEMTLSFCNEAETALARIRTSVRKTCVSSSRAEDRALCNEIATTYSELGKLFDDLGRRTKAQACCKKEEKWG